MIISGRLMYIGQKYHGRKIDEKLETDDKNLAHR